MVKTKNRTKKRQKAYPARQSTTVGLIVEGETEFHALPLLRSIFKGHCPPLKPINLGGVGATLTAEGVAKRLLGKVKIHLASGYRHVVICIDREQREVCAGQFAQAIYASLVSLLQNSMGSAAIDVVVADRTFEAWLLAGAEGLWARREFKMGLKKHCFEGELGAQSKKGVVELDTLLGRYYEKTRDGPRLFARLDFPAARKCGTGHRGSKSLDKFLRTLKL
jgi:hypothetical protein